MYLHIWIYVCEWKTWKTIIENAVIANELFDDKNVWHEIKMLSEQKNRSSQNIIVNAIWNIVSTKGDHACS